MGYYASFNGSITTKYLTQEEEQSLLNAYIASVGYESDRITDLQDLDGWGRDGNNECYTSEDGKKSYTFNFSGDDKYYEDEWNNFLSIFNPYLESGRIDFIGEDDCYWSMFFDNKTNGWDEEYGAVYYGEYALIMLNYETEDCTSPFFEDTVIVPAGTDIKSLEDRFLSFFETEEFLTGDLSYEEITTTVMDASGIRWERLDAGTVIKSVHAIWL